MNVHPGLTSHAKFKIFKNNLKALGVHDALEFLCRLWAHCQAKQLGENWGKVSPDYVEAIAEWNGKPGELWELLTKPFCGKKGWVHTDKHGRVFITGWDEHNVYLVNSWKNGRKGGRPPQTGSKPAINPRVNPPQTGSKPAGKPLLEMECGDGIRSVEMESGMGRGKENPPTPATFSSAPTLEQSITYCRKLGMDYSEEEIRNAWNSFEATKHESGQWWFGKRLCTDWRAAFETRLADNRIKNAPKNAGTVADEISKKTRKTALERLIENHPANSESPSYDENCSSEKRRELTQHRREIETLTRELAGQGGARV